MAIIRPTRKNSGVETLIKVLALLTEDVELVSGQILMSQFNRHGLQATKLSLFLEAVPYSFVGARNVWLQEYGDGVMVYYATLREAVSILERLEATKDYPSAFPATNKKHYSLCSFDQAAEHLRNYFLLGAEPDLPMSATTEEWLNNLLRATEWDVLATFDPMDSTLYR